ncbi:MAG: SDR family oxidoreductase [Balneola sp.]|uniref:SDR family oxidoreductase n=1 Tax=Balneola sp. EhC07 TaxID=1849360 RepID=UPI0007F4D443|nr:SDR family oxidoreductase [Balneola sp. EhC07]OAN64740.1 NAD-binding protein [Balneola sp. EhC07]
MNLKSKIAIVTGASSGIGAEFSKDLVKKGAKVYGLARSIDKLNSIREKLGNNFVPVQQDITDSESLETWVEETFSDDHSPDILINNAGLGYFANVDDLKISEWDKMLNVNLSGIFYLTRLVVPLMKQNENICHIVNISSIAGLMGNPQISAYNATKYGLRGFSDALFKELRYDGIKVSCFFPGSIATNFFDAIDEVDQHPNMMQASDVSDTLIHVLETPDNFLINEIIMRPLNPKNPG